MGFRGDQIALLAESGWARCGSIATAVREAGLPAVTRGHLESAFTATQWHAAERAVAALRTHFAAARFADDVAYGVLVVPDPAKLDTRRPMPPAVRTDQLGAPMADVVDERLSAGALGIPPGRPWTMVATVTGSYGPALGSHNQIVDAPELDFTVTGTDTRTLMIRQLWGARVLQCGATPPDCEANPRWTFTLLPAEGLTDGCAESGTVLKGRVRYRLGKPDRGIASARVAPAIAIN
ncbi:MAG TPA: hypothetical protein VH333_12000 [Pseudonocardiaceae bacterium]|nr:hypothetical protein [Pseudonocardiaceae bacterium]